MERLEPFWETKPSGTGTGVRGSPPVEQPRSSLERVLRRQRTDVLLEAGRPVLRDITRFIVGRR